MKVRLAKLLTEIEQIEKKLYHVRMMKEQPFFTPNAEQVVCDAFDGIGNDGLSVDIDSARMSLGLLYEEKRLLERRSEVSIRIANLQGKKEVVSTARKQAKKFKVASSALSKTAKLKVEVSLFLMEEFPNHPINPQNLWDLPENIKRKGRGFLRIKLASSVNATDFIKDIFRKPRVSQRRDYYESDYSSGIVN